MHSIIPYVFIALSALALSLALTAFFKSLRVLFGVNAGRSYRKKAEALIAEQISRSAQIAALSKRRCQQCGIVNEADAVFCKKCGNRIKDETTGE